MISRKDNFYYTLNSLYSQVLFKKKNKIFQKILWAHACHTQKNENKFKGVSSYFYILIYVGIFFFLFFFY